MQFHLRVSNLVYKTVKRFGMSEKCQYAPSSDPQFYNYFSWYKAKQVCHTMCRDLREAVGLGSPPAAFTTNASESINAMLKRKVDYKEREWPAFNENVYHLAKQQREEVIRSLSNGGQYRLLPQYSHFAVATTTWVRMRPKQRCDVIRRFDKATLKSKHSLPSMFVSAGSEAITKGACSRPLNPPVAHTSSQAEFMPIPFTRSSKGMLSVSAEASGITKLSLTTLQHMWEKAL